MFSLSNETLSFGRKKVRRRSRRLRFKKNKYPPLALQVASLENDDDPDVLSARSLAASPARPEDDLPRDAAASNVVPNDHCRARTLSASIHCKSRLYAKF